MKKKILIVEDNNDSLEILGLFITKIGHQVIKACNSKEAITCAEAEEPDLIFMDMNLPDVDGVKTIRTPTFFINGRQISGNQPLEAFGAILDEELGQTK
jgi:CheY-like chemotaxis protein